MQLGTYKFVGQPNQHTGGFRGFIFKVKQFVKNVFKFMLKLSAVSIVIATVYTAGSMDRAEHTVFAESPSNLSAKIDQLQNDVVNEIAKLENITNIPGVYDDNKAKSLPVKDKVSYGCMQFKISTIQHYYSVLKKGKISDIDSALLALDCDKAKGLAKEVIFKTQGGLWNWSVATKEMGMKVEVIKELSK